VGLCGSATLAMDPLGPPTAGLKQGQWSIGLEYSYSQMDFEASSVQIGGSSYDDYDIESAKVNKVYANLGYGVLDNWEVFGRIGGSSVDFTSEIWDWYSSDYQMPFEGDMGTAWGVGTKVTVFEQPNVKWGVLGQISWARSREHLSYTGYSGYDGDAKIDFYEIQVAVGPTCKLTDKVSVYGGPFFHYLDGDFKAICSDDESYDWEFDAEKHSDFGGYIGAQLQINENASLNAEYQLSEDVGGLSVGLVWKL
jgi:hypothetical protein